MLGIKKRDTKQVFKAIAHQQGVSVSEVKGLNKKLENLGTEDSTEIRKKNLIVTRELLQKQIKKAKEPAQK